MFKNTNELIARTYNVHIKKVFKNTNILVEEDIIFEQERKRLNIPNEVPNEAIGLCAIEAGNNLFKLI